MIRSYEPIGPEIFVSLSFVNEAEISVSLSCFVLKMVLRSNEEALPETSTENSFQPKK